MSTESPPKVWFRDVGFVLFLVALLVLFAALLLLYVVAKDWAEARTPWYGRAVLTITLAVVSVRVVRKLMRPARPRTAADMVAAVLVVGGALALVYFGVVRPAVQDYHRDAVYEARLAEVRGWADGLEAFYRELPDPTAATPDDITAGLRRAGEPPGRAPSVNVDELRLFTPEQRGNILSEFRRGTAATNNVNQRLAAFRETLKARSN